MSITINTRLDYCICKSYGGGVTRTHYEFSTGPRNLLKAIEILKEHQESMLRRFGKRGCGRSWLEIDEEAICRYDLRVVIRDDAKVDGRDASFGPIKSRTQKARELLADVKAGYSFDKLE